MNTIKVYVEGTTRTDGIMHPMSLLWEDEKESEIAAREKTVEEMYTIRTLKKGSLIGRRLVRSAWA